ncbi:MAG: hypothetical protein M3Y50_16515 [Acidobacteriota bacterium]|nr:hypothetical protein [Acidobacteriota bacterium]
MTGESRSHKNEPSAAQHEIADLLLKLDGEGFRKDEKIKSGYITLDIKISNSNKNKNAVSVRRNVVRFMVSDWLAENEAKQLDPPVLTARNDRMKKLEFPDLSASTIQKHSAFFQRMLRKARDESRYRQEH